MEPAQVFLLPPSNTHNGVLYLVLAFCFISQQSQVFLAGHNWHRSLSARKKIIVVHQRRRVMQSCCLLSIQVQNTIVSVLVQLIVSSLILWRCFWNSEHRVYDQFMQSRFCFPVSYFSAHNGVTVNCPSVWSGFAKFLLLRTAVWASGRFAAALSHWWFFCSWLKGREVLTDSWYVTMIWLTSL